MHMRLTAAIIGAMLVTGAFAGQSPCETIKLEDPNIPIDPNVPFPRFGYAVDVSGRTVVVGAPWSNYFYDGSGAVYVFDRVDGGWVQSDVLSAAQGEGAGAARWLSLDGDYLLLNTVNVRMFERIDGIWTHIQRIRPLDPQPYDGFGEALDLRGERAIVGAPRHNANATDSGAAYVFRREQDGSWKQLSKLTALDGGVGDELGTEVRIDGDLALAGAEADDDQGFVSGSVYVFRETSPGVWVQEVKLRAEDGGPGWRFGSAVAVANTQVLIGARMASGVAPYTGAVYVFEQDESGQWRQVQKLAASDGQNSDLFGDELECDGDLLLVSAYADEGDAVNAGSAYLFIRESDGVWREHAKLTASDGEFYDEFGWSIGLDGGWAVMGAPFDDDNGTDSGSAYIFRVGPDWSGNGVPDMCDCPGDIDYDQSIGLSDLSALLTNFGLAAGQSYESGDIDGDYDVDLADLSALLERYGTVCP